MRIAFVYDALYPYVRGGAERRYYELGKRLSTRHEVHYISWRHWSGPDPATENGMQLHSVGAPMALYGADGKRTLREAVSFSTRLLPTLLRHRFDVIDCSATPYLPLYSTWLASRISGTRLIATWHEFWGEHWHEYLPDRPSVARVARGLEGGARRLGDLVVAVSPFTARRMGLAADDPRLRIIGNGLPLEGIAEAPNATDAFDVLYVGRLIDEKRVDLLLEAIALLRAPLPALRCAIVGDGPERIALERQAARLGLERQVSFLGHVDDATAFGLMKAAKLFVQPSMREGFGMTVAEAQACGAVPVVVRSEASAAPDLVRDGVDGSVVDPTPNAIAESVLALMGDPRRRTSMSIAARGTATARGWDLLASRIEGAYLDALAGLPALAAAR
jgi:glycosyltransferase involved in cell wall biosynthesis